MSKRIKWTPQTWKLSELRPYDKNPRIIKESGLETLSASFDEIGYAQYININTDGTILSGHARFYQLQKEGALETEVLVPDRKLTPKQEEAVVIRMNKNTAGEWDFNVLANEFDLSDLEEWGFEPEELLGKVDEFNMDEDEAKESEKAFVLTATFPNETEMMNVYNELLAKGYVVKVSK